MEVRRRGRRRRIHRNFWRQNRLRRFRSQQSAAGRKINGGRVDDERIGGKVAGDVVRTVEAGSSQRAFEDVSGNRLRVRQGAFGDVAETVLRSKKKH